MNNEIIIVPTKSLLFIIAELLYWDELPPEEAIEAFGIRATPEQLKEALSEYIVWDEDSRAWNILPNQ